MRAALKGRQGETLAAGFLEEKGYRILARNFRSRFGEVDIIAQKDETVVFVEVKSWDAFPRAELEYSVNAGKRARIVETARVFLAGGQIPDGVRVRFDVILQSGGRFTHIEGAFGGEG